MHEGQTFSVLKGLIWWLRLNETCPTLSSEINGSLDTPTHARGFCSKVLRQIPLSFLLSAGLPSLGSSLLESWKGREKEGECLPVSVVSQHLKKYFHQFAS